MKFIWAWLDDDNKMKGKILTVCRDTILGTSKIVYRIISETDGCIFEDCYKTAEEAYNTITKWGGILMEYPSLEANIANKLLESLYVDDDEDDEWFLGEED